MVGICLKLERAPKRGMGNFSAEPAVKFGNITTCISSSFIFFSLERSIWRWWTTTWCLQTEREGRAAPLIVLVQGRWEVPAQAAPPPTHGSGRWGKAAVGREQRWELVLPSFPLRVTILGSCKLSCVLHNWPIRQGKFLTLSPSYALHEWLINGWMVGLSWVFLFCVFFFLAELFKAAV